MSEWTATDAAGIPRNVVGFVDGKPIYNAAEDRTCPECGLSFVQLRARLAEVEAENRPLHEALERIAGCDGEAAAPFVKIARRALKDADTA